jgi:hypothetical protein
MSGSRLVRSLPASCPFLGQRKFGCRNRVPAGSPDSLEQNPFHHAIDLKTRSPIPTNAYQQLCVEYPLAGTELDR